MEFKKITDNIFIQIEPGPEPIVLKLDELEAKIAEKRAQLEMIEPTDEELIEVGKRYHPFYIDKAQASFEIQRLEELITELENMV